MLRRGIRACDVFAVEAIERAEWRSLVPDLRPAATAENADFRAHVLIALKRIGGQYDLTDDLIAALSAPSVDARMTAAIGARQFTLERLRGPLLERVRRDPSYLVRYHAAESLLQLGDVYPPGLIEHPDIFRLMIDEPSGAGPSLAGIWAAPPSSSDLARFADAATRLDAAITARSAEGPCGKSMPLTEVALYVVRASDRALAITVEDQVGPCDLTLAFVALVRTRADVDRSYLAAATGKDPVHSEIPALPRNLPVEYSRATKTLTVGGVAIDLAKSNVVVLAREANGVTVRHRATMNLRFPHQGRPDNSGLGLFGLDPEIGAAAQALVERSPELRAKLAPDPQ
jgi:hypothetical protein